MRQLATAYPMNVAMAITPSQPIVGTGLGGSGLEQEPLQELDGLLMTSATNRCEAAAAESVGEIPEVLVEARLVDAARLEVSWPLVKAQATIQGPSTPSARHPARDPPGLGGRRRRGAGLDRPLGRGGRPGSPGRHVALLRHDDAEDVLVVDHADELVRPRRPAPALVGEDGARSLADDHVGPAGPAHRATSSGAVAHHPPQRQHVGLRDVARRSRAT